MGTVRYSLLADYAKGNIFIETGCQEGWTFYPAKQFEFTKMYGIELMPSFYDISVARFAGDDSISIIKGESPDVLRELCPTINEQVTFWLDAHASGPDIPGGKYGPCPLIQEIEAIALSPYKDHVIMIDDIRLFGTQEWDYIDRQTVIDLLLSINCNYKIVYADGEEDGTFPNDILIASTFI
jgi:hypothetical protein